MPEVRLIDANALIKVLSEQTFCCAENTAVKKSVEAALKYCNDIIEAAPTIEAEPVKHGRWIFGSSNTSSWMKCSECLKSQSGQTATFSYCPNCGAKMDGGAENG